MRMLLICGLSLVAGCNQNDLKTRNPENKPGNVQVTGVGNYENTKANIFTYTKRQSKINSPAGLQEAFIAAVCDSIIPYWIGTKWDFNGITETPGKGTIACGYFVTTVLRDAGVKINRIALAQCASEVMIQKLVAAKYINRYRNISLQTFIEEIKEHGKGLYITGLDNHTGFILYDNSGVWFIHSSYLIPGCVVKQNATINPILAASKYRVVGKISGDPVFLKSWRQNLNRIN